MNYDGYKGEKKSEGHVGFSIEKLHSYNHSAVKKPIDLKVKALNELKELVKKQDFSNHIFQQLYEADKQRRIGNQVRLIEDRKCEERWSKFTSSGAYVKFEEVEVIPGVSQVRPKNKIASSKI
jgi:hypothetical protein